MDLSGNKCLEHSALFSSQGRESIDGFSKTSLKNPFLDLSPNPNLKENSEFAKSFPVPNDCSESRGFLEIPGHSNGDKWVKSVTCRNVLEAPPTPGRPVFSFSNGTLSRKSLPSKWDDAEKWVVSGSSSLDSPVNNYHGFLRSMESSRIFQKQCNEYKIFAEKSRVTEEKVSSNVGSSLEGSFSSILHHHASAGLINTVSLSPTTDITLKDKFTKPLNSSSPKLSGYSGPMQESFLFDNSLKKSSNNATPEMVKHRDIGTEMTPLGSSTDSRCPTPFKSTSPARHNTPADRSGPLVDNFNTIDVTQLHECHLIKLNLGSQFDPAASNWSTREEEEEDVSKSLRHFELNSECRKSVSESRYYAWEEEEKSKSCFRYQREETKIQAWVNLQGAKAEAESRRLEVKIQKMRSNLEEKLMKRMAGVHRKAEEWRATAQFQHSEQIRRVDLEAKKVITRNKLRTPGPKSCGCFPGN